MDQKMRAKTILQ